MKISQEDGILIKNLYL